MYLVIKRIQELKTSAVEILALVYGIGLVNWSIHAYNNGLGIVSAIDFQYFIAGIFPFVTLIAFSTVLSYKFPGIHRMVRKTRLKLNHFIVNRNRAFRKIMIAIFMLIALLYFVFAYLNNEDEGFYFNLFLGVIMTVGAVRMVLTIDKPPHFVSLSFKQKRKLRLFLNPSIIFVGYSKFIIGFCSASFLVLYSSVIYPKIPQELGGGKAKSCTFQCKKGVFNDTITKYLFVDTSASVLCSRPVKVYYYDKDKLILKTWIQDHRRTLEINKSDIILIDWVD